MASTAVVAALVVPLSLLGPSEIAAAAPGPTSCGVASGPPSSLPAGTYSSVDVTGACAVNAGNVTVTGDVTVEPGAQFFAGFSSSIFGGPTGITVGGNILVGNGALMILGCDPSEFCLDSGTTNVGETVDGNITATGDLGVIIHVSTIGGNIVESGGGDQNCTGPGWWSDYEDNAIGGNLRVSGMNGCWFGALRNTVGGSLSFTNNSWLINNASNIVQNQIAGNLLCTGNSPAVQYGGATATPNVVGGFATGQCAFGLQDPAALMPIATPNTTPQGYWLGAADGGIFSYGVPFFGSQHGTALSQPIAGIAAVPGGGSYNLVGGDGTVFADGPHASDCTSVSGLNKPVVGIATAPGGNGCWLASSDGGVFARGTNAPFFGSAGALPLVKPVVGIAATPNNDGYDLVAGDGGIFTYGPGAQFYGSMGGKHLNQPIAGIAVDPVTGGYWEVARDGGIFAFNAPFFGSMGGKALNAPIVGMAAAPGGNGYYLVASDGGIFAFGTGAHFQGSAGSLKLVQPIVGMSLG
jgi:hypothetical protein